MACAASALPSSVIAANVAISVVPAANNASVSAAVAIAAEKSAKSVNPFAHFNYCPPKR